MLVGGVFLELSEERLTCEGVMRLSSLSRMLIQRKVDVVRLNVDADFGKSGGADGRRAWRAKSWLEPRSPTTFPSELQCSYTV